MGDSRYIADKRQRDFDDLQHELAGVDVGRMRRFLNADDDRSPEGKRRKQERTRRTLDDLMRDPEYARLYVTLGDRLRDAETRADAALEAIQTQLQVVLDEIALMEDAAARDLDGKQVFRFADGRVVYADGSEVNPDIAAGIIWSSNAPSAEDYFTAKSRSEALQDNLTEWGVYRNDVLGDVRDRYDSDDLPMSKDDLKDALDDIEQSAPDGVQVSFQDIKNDTSSVMEVSRAVIPSVLK